MSKKIKIFTLIIAFALVLALVFSACESFAQDAILGGEAGAAVESNGGYAVKQGKFLYFVNGKMGFPEDPDLKYNYFGKIRKGAIVRVGLKDDGALDIAEKDGEIDYESTFKVIVPKNIMTSNTTAGGFSIFGEWIYYVTPTTQTNANSTLMTDYLDYYRTKIDGTGTQFITRLKGQSLEYKFTPTGMIYVDPDTSSTLKTVTYSAKNIGATKVIAENVVGHIFPKSETHESGKTMLADYVFFVKRYTDDATSTFPGHELWAVTGDGLSPKEIIKIQDFTGGVDPSNEVKSLLYQMTLKNYRLTDDGGIEIYYNKSHYPGQSIVYTGLHGVKITSEFVCELNSETRFTNPVSETSGEENTFFPLGLDRGIILFGANKPTLEKPKAVGGVEVAGLPHELQDKTIYKNLGSATILKILKDGETEYMYFLSGNALKRVALFSRDNEEQISESTVATDWYTVDFCGGYFYYINTSAVKNNYLSRVSMYTPENIDTETGLPIDEDVAFRTEDDQKTWVTAVK